MKRIFSVSLIVFVMLILTNFVQAQTAFTNNAVTQISKSDYGQSVEYSATIISTDTLTSKAFPRHKYDADIDSSVFAGILSGGTESTRKITIQALGSWNGTNFYVLQTLMNADSSGTLIKKGINLGGYKSPWVQYRIYGTGANDTTAVKFWEYFPKLN